MDNHYSEQNHNQKSVPLLIVMAFLVLLIFLSIFYLLTNKPKINQTFQDNQNNQTATEKQKKQAISPTPISKIFSSKKLFKLALPSTQNTFSLNNQIEIEVYADSEGKNISGYDLIISYDPQGLEFVKSESNLVDFSLYSFKKDSYLSLTATKNLNSNAQTIFASNKIASLTFKPKKPGIYQISLLKNYGKEKTQMVDNQTNIYFPSLNKIKIEVI